MNKHEKFIKDLGFDEFSNLGDYLEFLRNGQEDVCINLLGNLLDASKEKGKLEQKKEELKRIIELQKKIRRYLIDNSRCDCLELTTKYGDISDVLFWEYEEQLQKEIGGMK